MFQTLRIAFIIGMTAAAFQAVVAMAGPTSRPEMVDMGGHHLQIEQFRHLPPFDALAEEAIDHIDFDQMPESLRIAILDPQSKINTWQNIIDVLSDPDELEQIIDSIVGRDPWEVWVDFMTAPPRESPFMSLMMATIYKWPHEFFWKIFNTYLDPSAPAAPMFNITTIITTENPRYQESGALYVQKFLEFLQRWLEHHYDRTGCAPFGTDRAEHLKLAAPMTDGRSAFIVINAWNNLYKVMSMLRISWRGQRQESRRLPVESHLDIDFDPPPEKFVVVNGVEYLESEDVEIKNFVHVTKEDPLDFIPLMFDHAFATGFFDGPPITKFVNGKEYAWRPARYLMYCDRQMAEKYYKHLGFEVFMERPEQDIVVMSISREMLMQIPAIMASRKGQRLLHDDVGTRLGPLNSRNQNQKRVIRPTNKPWHPVQVGAFDPKDFKNPKTRMSFFNAGVTSLFMVPGLWFKPTPAPECEALLVR